MNSPGLSSVLRLSGRERRRSSTCQESVSSTPGRHTPTKPPGQTSNPAFHSPNPLANYHFSHIALDALAQVKRGLRSLFSRRKKKKQPAQPEPTPSSNNPPTQTLTAPAVAPVEAPTTSKRSSTDAPRTGALPS